MKRQTLALSVCALISTGILTTPHSARAQGTVLGPGMPIIGIAGTPGNGNSIQATVGTAAGLNNYPGGETPDMAIDGNIDSKYLNFAEVNTGFIVTIPGVAIVNGFRFTTANDAPERDPVTISLEGTSALSPNNALEASWTPLYIGVSGLGTDPGRELNGQTINFANALSYNTYRLLITEVRSGATANSMQFSEVQFYAVPEPTTYALLGLGVAGWLLRRRK
jgi:hypothetical protein